jgi:hypothetical protein
MMSDFIARNKEMLDAASDALRNAHAQGKTADAQKIANHILVLQSEKNAAAYSGNVDPRQDGTIEKLYRGAKHAVQQAYYSAKDGLVGINDADREHLQQGRDYIRTVGAAAEVGDLVGGIAPYIGTAIATRGLSLLPRAVAQASTGGLVTDGGVGNRLAGAALGGAGEFLGNFPGKALSRPIEGTEAARRLVDMNVYPTVGQAMGGFAKKTEDVLTSMPFLGDAINMGRNGALKEGVAAAQSLGGVPGINRNNAGFEANQIINKHFADLYPTVTAPLTVNLDNPAFVQATGDALRRNNVTPSGRADVNMVLNNSRIDGSGVIGGTDVHNLIQALRQRSNGLKASPDPYARATGQAFSDVRRNLPDNMSASGTAPEALEAFNAANRSYALTTPAMKASETASAARNDGMFTPTQYANAVTGNAKSQGNRAGVREGDAPGQGFANDLFQTLGNTYQDSGTTTRYLLNRALIDVVGGGGVALLGQAVPLAAATGVSAAMNSPIGRKYMLGGYEWQQALNNALRSTQPYAGALGAGAMDYQYNK